MKKNNEKLDRRSGSIPSKSIAEAKPTQKSKRTRTDDTVVYESEDIRKINKLRMAEKRRDRSRSISMSLFVLLIMLVTVILILNVMKRNEPKPQFMFIQQGTIEHNITTDAILVREETVINSSDNGILKPIIQSGSRVSFGQTVAVILREGSEADLATLKNYEQQITNLQMQLVIAGKGSGAEAIYKEADNSISAQINMIRRDAVAKTFVGFSSYRTSIDVAMSRRENRLLNIDFKDATLKELKKNKAELEKNLGIVASNIIVKDPGILSYNLDGLEKTLSPKTVEKMSMDDFYGYLDSGTPLMTAGLHREKETSAVKIITGIYQYIVMVIPETDDSSFAADSVHTLRIPESGASIENCYVYRKIIQSGKLLLILRTDRQVVRFADTRDIKVLISTKNTTGLRIPYSSITNIKEDGTGGDIMLVVSGYARKIPVKIIDSDSEYAIIEADEPTNQALLLNGYLVKNPGSVQEGENIGR